MKTFWKKKLPACLLALALLAGTVPMAYTLPHRVRRCFSSC